MPGFRSVTGCVKCRPSCPGGLIGDGCLCCAVARLDSNLDPLVLFFQDGMVKYFVLLILSSLFIFACQKREAEKSQATRQNPIELETWKYDHRMMIRLNAEHIINDAAGISDLGNHSSFSTENEPFFFGCVKHAEEYADRIRTMPKEPPELSEAKNHLVEMSLALNEMLSCFSKRDSNGSPVYLLLKEDQARFLLASNSVLENFKRLDLKIPK